MFEVQQEIACYVMGEEKVNLISSFSRFHAKCMVLAFV